MNAEELAVLLGELITTEVDDIYAVNYIKKNGKETVLRVVMENGRRFTIAVTTET